MATVDKNFKVKHGLIVEGTTATVNGEDIITTGSTTDSLPEGTTNLYFTNQRALDAVGGDISSAVSTAINALSTSDIEEGTNLYFTNERAQDAIGTAITNGTQSGITVTYDDTDGEIAFSVADQWTGKTTDDLTEGTTNKYFTNQRALDATASAYDAAGAATTAENNAKSYADSLATNYDAAGAASTAETNANTYTDTKLGDYTKTIDLDETVDGYGYLKSADLSGYATESYVTTAVDNLVDGAPGLLDTLNEIAAAINDDANYATTMTTALAGKQNELTAGTNISIVSDTISVTGLSSTDISDFSTAALSATASAYDAAGAAASAQTAAENYADGLATNYDAAGTASGLVDDLKDGTTAFTAVNINSLAKQVAATSTSLGSVAVTAYSFAKAAYKTAKFLVKIDNGTENEVSEVLLTLDSSDNIAITEYAIVGTNGSRGTITADISGSDVRLRVTPVNDSTINVVGTLLV